MNFDDPRALAAAAADASAGLLADVTELDQLGCEFAQGFVFCGPGHGLVDALHLGEDRPR